MATKAGSRPLQRLVGRRDAWHSVGSELDNQWSARLAPNKRSVYSVHSLEVRLRIFIENLKPSRSPRPPEVNPDATTVCKRVADPMSAGTVFDHHDDSAAVIEISDRNAVPLPGPTADGLDDEGIPAVVGRARDSNKKRKVGDRVGDAYNGPRKLHRLASDLAVQRPQPPAREHRRL